MDNKLVPINTVDLEEELVVELVLAKTNLTTKKIARVYKEA